MSQDASPLTAPQVEDGLDFALAVFRDQGVWRIADIPEDRLHDTETLADELRRWPGDFGSLGLVSVDDEFFVLGRVAGPTSRWLLSDVTAAADWALARSVVEELGIPVPDEDDLEDLDDLVGQPLPAGDLSIVADLGMPARDLAMLLDDVDLYPDEILEQVAERLGFGAAWDETLSTEPVGAPLS